MTLEKLSHTNQFRSAQDRNFGNYFDDVLNWIEKMYYDIVQRLNTEIEIVEEIVDGSTPLSHGVLDDLGAPADDHTQYLLIDGTRVMIGDLTIQKNNPALHLDDTFADEEWEIANHAGVFTLKRVLDGPSFEYLRVNSAGIIINNSNLDFDFQINWDDGTAVFLDGNTGHWDFQAGNIETIGTVIVAQLIDNGLDASSSVYTDASKQLSSTAPTSGVLGHWDRTGTVLSPATAGDDITTTGDIFLEAATNATLYFGTEVTGNRDGYIRHTGIQLDIVANAKTPTDLLNMQAGSFTFRTGDNTDVAFNLISGTGGGQVQGTFVWMKDETYFQFVDDIFMQTTEMEAFTEKIYFGDTDVGIYSQTNSFLDLFADGAVRIGNSGTSGTPLTTYIAILPGGDTFWTGDGSGLLNGHMFTNVTIATTLVNSGTFYELDGATAWTAGHLNGCTFTDPGITVLKAGMYEVVWSLSTDFSASPGSKQEIEYAIMVDGVVQDEGQAHRTLQNSTDTGNACGVGSVDLAANQVVSLAAKNETSSGKILHVAHGNMSVKQIGGT